MSKAKRTAASRPKSTLHQGVMILHGVAATLSTLGAPLLESDDGDERMQGETFYFLTTEIERAIGLVG